MKLQISWHVGHCSQTLKVCPNICSSALVISCSHAPTAVNHTDDHKSVDTAAAAGDLCLPAARPVAVQINFDKTPCQEEYDSVICCCITRTAVSYFLPFVFLWFKHLPLRLSTKKKKFSFNYFRLVFVVQRSVLSQVRKLANQNLSTEAIRDFYDIISRNNWYTGHIFI